MGWTEPIGEKNRRNEELIMDGVSDSRYEARKQFFNDAAETWMERWYWDDGGQVNRHEKAFERLFSLLPLKDEDRVLDAGCGSGVLVPYILNKIGKTGILYELDFAEQMIETNRRLHQQENICFMVSDVENAPLQEAFFDVAICFSCFPHFQDKEKALQALWRILKSRGILLISHFDSAEVINKLHKSCRPVRHDHLPDEKTLRALLERNGFDIDLFIHETEFYCIRALRRDQGR